MVIFRDYQEKCIQTIHNHFKENSKQLIQLPTGSGKTYIFLEYIKRHSKRALIIVPTIELLEQIKESSLNFFHHSQVYAKTGGRFKDSSQHIIVTAASLNYSSTQQWLGFQQFDTIIIDEAHRAFCPTYMNFLEVYDNYSNDFNLLGFTATPERLDNQPLLQIFDSLTFDMNILDLITEGHLTDIEATRHETGQKLPSYISNGDFRAIELRKLDNDNRNNIITKIVKEHCQGKQTIVFCLNIQHSESLAKKLREMGFNCEAIHGKLNHKERRRITSQYREGNIQIVTNCQLLTEGFDAPCTQSIIIARPTRSKSLYCQMIGRGLRTFNGKDVCHLHELTDNNHNICTFNVLAGGEPSNIKHYKPGIRLSEHAKTFKIHDIEDIEFSITKSFNYDIFKVLIDSLECQVLDNQMDKLNEFNIKYFEPLSYEEAAFLLWKNKKMREYGINN